ncbi:hypothetical protein [Litoreibacter roseus]|uniref:Uncharacterized protein n=1 Tax=Litoreibacter roseus TaxID=2601869 RepID=A0A6N6JCN2_9RHOB|nr:hypothetical protein [Litoreibacter roseus]GFE63590.1 hypothetical protein KIN_06640 [Litoreibacter roseus]
MELFKRRPLNLALLFAGVCAVSTCAPVANLSRANAETLPALSVMSEDMGWDVISIHVQDAPPHVMALMTDAAWLGLRHLKGNEDVVGVLRMAQFSTNSGTTFEIAFYNPATGQLVEAPQILSVRGASIHDMQLAIVRELREAFPKARDMQIVSAAK